MVIDPKWSLDTVQSFYLDRTQGRNWGLKPNVVLLKPTENGNNLQLLVETNSWGFRGPEVDPSKKLAAVWGDSVVFGVHGETSWVEGLAKQFPGYQFLNGGIEGDTLPNIYARAIEANQHREIKWNIMFIGWHTLIPDHVRDFVSRAVDKLRGPVLCTVPTCLNEKAVDIDLSSYLDPTPDLRTSFTLCMGSILYSKENAMRLFGYLKKSNEVLRNIASERGVPLVDLYNYFYTNDLSRLRDDFFDAGHPRPQAYPKLQQAFRETLKSILV